MSGKIRVLELFHEYLNPTENWAFRMIDNLPDCDIVVGAKRFKKNNFYPAKFEYLEFPLRPVERPEAEWAVTFNKVVSKISRLYPRYLAKTAGPIDLMHSHFSFVGWDYRKLAKRLGVPHIVSLYGFDYENLPYLEPVWNQRYPVLFGEADLFLCEGEHGARVLKQMGCPEEKVLVARLGVDTGKIPYYARNKKSGELNLLQIASLVGKKGHIYTVKAFAEASKRCPNMTLTIVGKDHEGIKAQLQAVIRESGIDGKVTFLDFIDFSRLHEFMKDYQVFIHPSCYTEERDCEGGAPVVLLDAQATGMPVIASTHCDIPDEVVHGETGLLAPEKDSAAIASLIEQFYRMDENAYQGFCKNATAHIARMYDAKQNAEHLRMVYSQLLGRTKC